MLEEKTAVSGTTSSSTSLPFFRPPFMGNGPAVTVSAICLALSTPIGSSLLRDEARHAGYVSCVHYCLPMLISAYRAFYDYFMLFSNQTVCYIRLHLKNIVALTWLRESAGNARLLSGEIPSKHLSIKQTPVKSAQLTGEISCGTDRAH